MTNRTCAVIVDGKHGASWQSKCGAPIVEATAETRMNDQYGDPVTVTKATYVCTQGHEAQRPE